MDAGDFLRGPGLDPQADAASIGKIQPLQWWGVHGWGRSWFRWTCGFADNRAFRLRLFGRGGRIGRRLGYPHGSGYAVQGHLEGFQTCPEGEVGAGGGFDFAT